MGHAGNIEVKRSVHAVTRGIERIQHAVKPLLQVTEVRLDRFTAHQGKIRPQECLQQRAVLSGQPVSGKDHTLEVEQVLQKLIGRIRKGALLERLDLILHAFGELLIVRQQLINENGEQEG